MNFETIGKDYKNSTELYFRTLSIDPEDPSYTCNARLLNRLGRPSWGIYLQRID